MRRIEDERFLIGAGRFVDDIGLSGTCHAVLVRSPHAHARVRRVETAPACAAPGVLLVLTGDDVRAERLPGLPCRFFPHSQNGAYRPMQPILALDKVRHVGDRVALVVAETLEQAKDAAELVEVEYEPLSAVVSVENCLEPGATKVWDDAPDNVSFRLEQGDGAAVRRAMLAADHLTRISFHYPRASANAIEPRSVLATCDRGDRHCTVYSSHQAPFRLREILCEVLGIPATRLRVVAPDVGGAFGSKGNIYPEDALVLWAAQKLRRAVKWTAERGEALASDMHGRDIAGTAELGLTRDGRILALSASVRVNLGAYLGYAAGVPAMVVGASFTSAYDVPLVHTQVSAVFTNTSLMGPYRGSGKPEANYVLERLIDKAARELGVDALTIRRRNLVPAAAMPYRTAGAQVYDVGEFERILDRAIDLADWRGFSARRAASEARGRRRGIGLAMHCFSSGLLSERMEIRIDEGGSVAVHAGTLSTGQGHETMYAQMASAWLGVPLDKVSLFQGDTDRVLFGRGTFAERSALIGGSALRAAADAVIAKGRRIAAFMLGASEAAIEFDSGVFRDRGSNRAASLSDVARGSYHAWGLPAELGVGLDGTGSFAGTPSFPNGCFVCEVEVDPETGQFAVVQLALVDDVGVVINPLTLEGQMHGSSAQGLGQVIGEEVRYDAATGQLLTGSFMDYVMPRADDMPAIRSEFIEIPATSNPLGVKGGSEAGNMAVPAAVVNALVDALAEFGISDLPLPAPAHRIWTAIEQACRRRSE